MYHSYRGIYSTWFAKGRKSFESSIAGRSFGAPFNAALYSQVLNRLIPLIYGKNSKMKWLWIFYIDIVKLLIITRKIVQIENKLVSIGGNQLESYGLPTPIRNANEICSDIEYQREINWYTSRYTKQYFNFWWYSCVAVVISDNYYLLWKVAWGCKLWKPVLKNHMYGGISKSGRSRCIRRS